MFLPLARSGVANVALSDFATFALLYGLPSSGSPLNCLEWVSQDGFTTVAPNLAEMLRIVAPGVPEPKGAKSGCRGRGVNHITQRARGQGGWSRFGAVGPPETIALSPYSYPAKFHGRFQCVSVHVSQSGAGQLGDAGRVTIIVVGEHLRRNAKNSVPFA